MMRFIYGCIAVAVLSFFIVPMISGVSSEREKLMDVASIADAPDNGALSFAEIYEIAASDSADGALDASALNDITPAAGVDDADSFSTGFTGRADSALEDAPAAFPAANIPMAQGEADQIFE